MNTGPSRLNQFSWNPLIPTLFLSFNLWRFWQRGWEGSWLQWVSLAVAAIWLALSVYNVLTRGAFLKFLYEDDELELAKAPRTLSEVEKMGDVTPLLLKLRSGLEGHNNFSYDLAEFKADGIQDKRDALAVISTYLELVDRGDSSAGELLALFGSARSEEVFGMFYGLGMPALGPRLQALLSEDLSSEEVSRELFAHLRAVVGFGYEEFFPEMKLASSSLLLSDSYYWVGILGCGDDSDSDYLALLKNLAEDVPPQFAGIALLDRCNELCLNNSFAEHPFRNDSALGRIREWLADDEVSYAVSATVALPFLAKTQATEMLKHARKHSNANVRVEAAWAAAKMELPEGQEDLIALAADWRTGELAMRYLHEVNPKAILPPHLLEASYRARCAMAEWLSHPNELGKLPASLEIIDQRSITWPPVKEVRTVSLLKWKLDDNEGVGMTGGSTTWCFFGDVPSGDNPLDAYAQHCNWELQKDEAENAPKEYSDLEHGRRLLREANPNEDWQSSTLNA